MTAPPLTAAPGPPLTATRYGVQIVLSWSTNITGFSLMSTTNLPATIWQPVSPAPVVVEGLNVVTNDTSGNRRFYRLVGP